MNSILQYLKLVRYKNLLIIVLVQCLLKFTLINVYLDNTALSLINFIIYLLTLIFIVAGGYIINDIYDLEIDKINKNNNQIIDNTISKDSAHKTYYILNFLSLIGAFYVARDIENIWLAIIFIYLIFSLWIYSKKYKKTLIIGNLQVAFLTALSIYNLAIYDILPLLKDSEGSYIIQIIIIAFSLFSFIITFIREIVKDIEDIEGDNKFRSNTLPIKYGIIYAKKVAILFIIIAFAFLVYFQYFQYSVLNTTFSFNISYWGVNKISILYTILIEVVLVLLLKYIYSAKTKSDFENTSKICKYIMILGILSIPTFTFSHLYI